MALKYNDTTNLITTDDIIVTSSVSELGENLSDILEAQSNDIAQLKSNVKWIAKYGGVGGGGSGSGGSGTVTNTKFNLTVSYRDNNGTPQSVTTNQKEKTIAPILSKYNESVSITVQIVSVMSNTINYSAVFDKGDGFPNSQTIYPTTRQVTYTFPADEVRQNWRITIYGETTTTVPFSIFTQIVSNDSYLFSGEQRFSNDASVDPAYKEGLSFKTVLENLLPDAFDLYLDSISLNNQTIYSVGDEQASPEILIDRDWAVGDRFTSYGLYNIVLNYHAIDKITPTKIYDYSSSYVYIYKESNKAFVYCYTDELSDFVIYNERTNNPVGTSLRNVPLYFRVYGQLSDPKNTTYSVDINGVTYKRPCRIMQNYSYNLPNKVLDEENYQEVAIEFNVNNIITTYYIYLKNPGELSYVFKKDGVKCYAAIGDNTDAIEPNGSISFPERIDGETYWSFTDEVNNKLTVNRIPENYISPNIIKGTKLSVLNFIQSNRLASGNDGLMYDGIVNIGINYKDTSYEKAIFTLTDGSDNKIDFYRNKIQNGPQDATNRFGMPDDGNFHLITIYFKQNYNSVPDLSSIDWDGDFSFAVYIDGVLDVKPTRTPFAFGLRSTCEFYSGNTQYNFFGVEIFNPVSLVISTSSSSNQTDIYSGAVKKYLEDYDPFIVSNYFMCYASAHYKDLGYSSQPFTEDQLKADVSVYYSGLISNSTQNYINYYNTDGVTYNKFIPVNIQTFSNLLNKETTIPIYRIVPTYSSSDVSNGLHTFVLNTMTSYRENDNSPLIKSGYECKFQRYDLSENTWKDILEDYSEDGILHQVKFKVKYQGSSTLLYSVKNFAIETIPYYIEQSHTTYTYYFNPDSDVFDYPETSFNLKADLVDSSSCTNNVMGNFINDYMSSPFNDNNHNKTLGNEFKTCLSGRPILLFINNNITNDTSVVTDDLFLGIYNLNLNRGSVNNLGYQQILDTNLQKIDGNFRNIYWQITTQNTNIRVPEGLTVAEVQGNGNVYDFSQYDYGLLNQIFGDFYTVSGGRVIEQYSNSLQQLCRDFSLYVRNNIVTSEQRETFPANDYGLSDSAAFTNYYQEFSQSNEISKLRYYRMQEGGGIALTEIPPDSIIVDYNTMEGLNPSYRRLINNLSVVGNANYQFHLVYDINGTPPAPFYKNSSYYYYVEHSRVTLYDPGTNVQIFDLDNSIKYYIVCMAFAMVDSVQKNLNVKRPDNGTTWYPQFYDMDTALGLDNSGNNSNYKAFSDFVTEDGTIISDYADPSASEWFDTPSSYLFLYAKYDALLNKKTVEGTKDRTPIQYWLSLRGVNSRVLDLDCVGALENAGKFCDTYLNTYITNDIPPIVWNLNYLYKYFSETKNTGGINHDTEESRFNGRMIYRRRTWLNQRLHYLDALFGISNSRPIGNSNSRISESEIVDGNLDIEIVGTMFPGFQKGVDNSVPINAVVKDQPRTPIIFRTNTDNYILYITNDEGLATIRDVKINSNVDVAFNGTKHLISISNCGNLLQNPTLSSNTIVGDQIEKIVISSSCKSAIIDLENLQAVKEIIIHSSPDSPNNGAKTITIGEIQIKGKESNPSEVRIFIQNVSCKNLSISNCIFKKGSTDSTSSKISGIVGNCILSITGCVIQSAFSISNSSTKNKISQFKLDGNTFAGNFAIYSDAACKLSVNNITLNSGSVFSIVASAMTDININNSRIFTITHNSSVNLKNCNINLVNSASGNPATAYIILNQSIANASTFLYNIGSSEFNNTKLTQLSISLSGNYGTSILRAPLLRALTTLNLTGKFKLGRMGLAGCGLPQVTLDPTQENGIVGFSVSNNSGTAIGSQGIFLGFEGSFVNKEGNPLTAENWAGLINGVYNLQYAFANRTSGLTMDEVVNILAAIKASISVAASTSCNIWGLFHGTKIINSGTSAVSFSSLPEETRYQLIDRIVQAWPSNALNDGTLVFQRTNFDVLTKELANKINSKVYRNFMGSSSLEYIESGALNNFTTVTDGVLSEGNMSWNRGSSNVVSYYPIAHFFTRDENNVTQLNNLELKYSEEFSKAADLRLQIYTSVDNNVSFDYETGMGTRIKNYYGLFTFGNHVGNVYNIQNMFNNTTNLTTVYTDFRAFSLTINDLNDPRIVNLYNFLVDTTNPEEPRINNKAYNILTANGDNDDYGLCGSFYKIITGGNFKKLIELLHDEGRGTIRRVFHNCTVINITQEPREFFEEAFIGKLYGFSSFYSAFRKCKFLNSSGKEIPMVLDNAFTREITLDGETSIQYSKIATNLKYAFQECFIEPFSATLGINQLVIKNGYRAFYNCTYNYPSITDSPISQYSAPSMSTFQVPSNQKPILPEDFLECCDGTELSTREMFAYDASSTFSASHLTGYIPENENYFGDVKLFDTFQRCNIYYHQYNSKQEEQEVEGEEITVTTTQWIIFPKWYTSASNSNDIVNSGPFNNFIPLPIFSGRTNEKYICSIFGMPEDISLQTSYGKLPRFPSKYSGLQTAEPLLLKKVNKDAIIYLTLGEDGQLPLQGTYFKKMLPLALSPLVVVKGSGDTIVSNILDSFISTDNYLPLNETDIGLDKTSIFRGVIAEYSEGDIFKVIAFSTNS